MGLVVLLIYYALRALELLLLIYCVFSWFIRDPNNKIYAILSAICDPILAPIRSVLERISFLNGAGIDFSPVVLMLIISFIMRIL